MNASVFSRQNDDWIKIGENNNIRIYKRPIDKTNIREFKGVLTDSSRIEVMSVILLDISGYTSWLPYLNESKIVKQNSDDHFFVYQHYQVLWPYQNRDCLVEVKIDRDYNNGIIHATMFAVNDTMTPIRNDIHRIINMKSEIELRYINRDVTECTYSASIDFGGHMPDWLINIINKRLPIEVLSRIKDESKKTVYKNMSMSSSVKKNIEDAIGSGFLQK